MKKVFIIPVLNISGYNANQRREKSLDPNRDLSTAYDAIFNKLANLATIKSGYPTGNSTEVIYSASGTFEDYAFWKHGIWSLLFELGYSHSPSESDVEEIIDRNVPGLIKLMQEAPQKRADDHGFKGSCDWRLLSRNRHDE